MALEPRAAMETASVDGFQPGHDIFFTPNNSSFYAKMRYSELNFDQQEVRLVKLWPENDESGLLQCTLLPAAPLLEAKGQYTALSYCAGDPKNTEPIILDGVKFNVFANLGHALREARHFWRSTYGDRECLMWIDQISINQSDVEERSHQVRFMREIYQYAEKVLVCLSTKESHPRGMEWLLELVEAVVRGCEEHQLETNPSYLPGFFQYLATNIENEEFVNGWLAFYEVVDAPWWKRAWVFQEFVVASEVHIMYSGRFGSCKKLFPSLKGVPLGYSYMGYLQNPSILSSKYDFQWANLRTDNLQRVIDYVDRKEIWGTMNKIGFMIESKQHWRQNLDFKELLRYSRYCGTTDSRDKIFAFIGLTDPAYGILPDYSQTINQVLTETTMKIIQHEDSLDVLCDAAQSRSPRYEGIPSWVVDWTSTEQGEFFHLTMGPGSRSQFYGFSQNNSIASFLKVHKKDGDWLAIRVKGTFIDKVPIQPNWGPSLIPRKYPYTSFISSNDFSVKYFGNAQRGDELWIIDGCSAPLILRREQDHEYRLITTAQITNENWYDSIQGQARDLLQLPEREHENWQNISII